MVSSDCSIIVRNFILHRGCYQKNFNIARSENSSYRRSII